MIKKTLIEARDLSDAWFQVCEACYMDGRDYTITGGSYVGQKRRELEFLVCHIRHPNTRPLLPEVPEGVPLPVDGGIDFIEQDYLRTVMTQLVQPNEVYTYGERIFGTDQIFKLVKLLKKGYGTNQACLSISDPYDIEKDDSPCWRLADIRIDKDRKLHMFHYFRSWDLYNGFPANLAAFVYLQEFICEEVGGGVDPGEFICVSKGAHLYDHVWNVVENYIVGK